METENKEKIELSESQAERLKKLCGEEKAQWLMGLPEEEFLSELDYLILIAKSGEHYDPTPESRALQKLYDDILYQ